MKMYIGVPGCGKSTMAVRALLKHRGPRYSNFDNTISQKIDPKDLGSKFVLEPNSLLVIDEAGICFSNRNYKTNFTGDLLQFVKLWRHYQLKDVIILSQAWDDVDIVLRRLIDELYLLKKLGPFTLVLPIKKKLTIDQATQQIIDGYKFEHVWKWRIFLRSKYYEFFNTFEIPEATKEIPYYSDLFSNNSTQ